MCCTLSDWMGLVYTTLGRKKETNCYVDSVALDKLLDMADQSSSLEVLMPMQSVHCSIEAKKCWLEGPQEVVRSKLLIEIVRKWLIWEVWN